MTVCVDPSRVLIVEPMTFSTLIFNYFTVPIHPTADSQNPQECRSDLRSLLCLQETIRTGKCLSKRASRTRSRRHRSLTFTDDPPYLPLWNPVALQDIGRVQRPCRGGIQPISRGDGSPVSECDDVLSYASSDLTRSYAGLGDALKCDDHPSTGATREQLSSDIYSIGVSGWGRAGKQRSSCAIPFFQLLARYCHASSTDPATQPFSPTCYGVLLQAGVSNGRHGNHKPTVKHGMSISNTSSPGALSSLGAWLLMCEMSDHGKTGHAHSPSLADQTDKNELHWIDARKPSHDKLPTRMTTRQLLARSI
nr:hypothetical protein CFP56_36265 [Quercus suber]